jgi:hydroxymethylglutaryl-CoA synthase
MLINYFLVIFKSKTSDSLKNNRICLFSYGSGLASAMFSLLVNDTNVNSRFKLENILNTLNEQKTKLAESRIEIEPDMYDAYLQQREITHKQAPREAKFNETTLYPGTWYLKSIDEKYRRAYDKKMNDKNGENFNANTSATHLNQQLSKF